MKDNFDKYIDLKKRLALNYKDYKLEQVLAIFLCANAYKKEHLRIKSIFRIFFFKDFHSLSNSENKVCLFTINPFKRADYYEIWDYIRNRFKNSDASFIDLSDLKYNIQISVKNIAKSFSHVFRNAPELSLQSKLQLSIEFCFLKNSIDNLENVDLKFKKYIAFSGITHWENLLTQYFNIRGITTYSLQHGVTYIFTRNIPLDALLYENLHSKYSICWGQYTKDELIKYGYSPKNILIGGYPREIQFTKVEPPQNKNKFIIFLSRESYKLSNMKLLKIIAEITKYCPLIKFYIKLHPSSNYKKYIDIINSIGNHDANQPIKIIPSSITSTKLLKSKEYDCAIAINTAVYYEAYLHGLICFRFEDGSFDQSTDISTDIFTNTSELLTLINNSMVHEYYDAAQIQERLKYSIGAGVDNYYDVIMQND